MKQLVFYLLNGKIKVRLKNKQQLTAKLSALASTKINYSNSSTSVIAAIDSGASDHYFPALYNGEEPCTGGTSHEVGTANGSIM